MILLYHKVLYVYNIGLNMTQMCYYVYPTYMHCYTCVTIHCICVYIFYYYYNYYYCHLFT